MITISAGEFRANQKEYLDKVSRGTDLLVTRKNDAFKITRASKDDTLLSKETFLAQLEDAIADVKRGNTYKMNANETLDEFMERMKKEGYVLH